MTSEQNRPQRPRRDRVASDRGANPRSVEQMLATRQREGLRADLAKIALRRRQAEDASSSFWLR